MTRKILIVDDDQKTRTLLKTYLEKNQYEVRLAHDGAAFLSEFERYKDELSLVILDVMLPDTDGFALCRIVRKHSNVPIIILTASPDSIDLVVGLELVENFRDVPIFVFRTVPSVVRSEIFSDFDINILPTKNEAYSSELTQNMRTTTYV